MTEIDLLVGQLSQAFDRRSWHGTNLYGSIRGLGPEQAAFRPADGAHNIWEILLHAAYWKYTVYRRITGAGRGSFPLKGSNWFKRPESGTVQELKADIQLLKAAHRDLIDSVRALPPKSLDQVPAGSKFCCRDLILGVASHDLYHAGQIQLIKRLLKVPK